LLKKSQLAFCCKSTSDVKTLLSYLIYTVIEANYVALIWQICLWRFLLPHKLAARLSGKGVGL